MEVAFQPSSLLTIRESNEIGHARRRTAVLAEKCGLGEEDVGRAALVATELATNLIKHAQGGKILLRILQSDTGERGLELLSLDTGAGSNLSHDWLRDGFSTAGSAGEGLGAIRRSSEIFDLYSVRDHGSAVLSQIWSKRKVPQGSGVEGGAVCLPLTGETECGDAWVLVRQPKGVRLSVLDGLGHGHFAAVAAGEGVQSCRRFSTFPTRQAMEHMHQALRPTRGAAAAITDVDFTARQVHFAGVGNISAFLISNRQRTGLVSVSGIVGHDIRRLREYSYGWSDDACLILHSDGLKARWELNDSQYRELLLHHPSLVAGVLYRDFGRGTDDTTVVVVKARSGNTGLRT